ncbi:MAG: ABC transporter ATP-binding protein [Cyanobacteria bacterium P01_F01_bin.153]
MTPSPLSDSSPAVTVTGITKSYRTGFWLNQSVTTVQDVSFSVPRGQTFGLLGPNGAGKTTLLKLLLGIAKPTAGAGTVLGMPLGDRSTKQRLGYLPENAYFYDYLTGWEYLEHAAAIFQLPRQSVQRRIGEILDQVQLSHDAAKKKLMKQYSKGMLQRVGVAQALINDPELVFLDEPMSGLDPLGRYQIREIILNLKDVGKTIFFNSHILSDVEQVCDSVAILANGKLLCWGALEEMLTLGDSYQVRGRGGEVDKLRPWLGDMDFQNGWWQGELERDLTEFVGVVSAMGGEILQANRQRQSLEAFFVTQLRRANVVPS